MARESLHSGIWHYKGLDFKFAQFIPKKICAKCISLIFVIMGHINCRAQNCSNSIADAMELPDSCAKLYKHIKEISIWNSFKMGLGHKLHIDQCHYFSMKVCGKNTGPYVIFLLQTILYTVRNALFITLCIYIYIYMIGVVSMNPAPLLFPCNHNRCAMVEDWLTMMSKQWESLGWIMSLFVSEWQLFPCSINLS